MNLVRRTCLIKTANSANQTLPTPAVKLLNVYTLIAGSATWYTIVTGSPGAGEVQFTGSPQNPSSTLTFQSALAAGGLLLAEYVPAGAIAAAA